MKKRLQCHKKARHLAFLCMLLCILVLSACVYNPGTDEPATVSIKNEVQNIAAASMETDRLRELTADYLGTWYLSGTHDVTLELSEEYNASANTYKLFFGFSKLAPKTAFILPYDTLENQMKSIGIEFLEGQIIVKSGGTPYTFVREAGNDSVTVQFPHLDALGRWYLQENPEGYVEFYTECYSANYDRSIAYEFLNFDIDDMGFCNANSYEFPGGALYNGEIFGDESGVSGQNIWFQLDGDFLHARHYTSLALDTAGTVFTRTKN